MQEGNKLSLIADFALNTWLKRQDLETGQLQLRGNGELGNYTTRSSNLNVGELFDIIALLVMTS